MIKIVFFDIDGTLLDFGHKELSTKTLYTLKQLQKNGILLCMATGRGYPSIPHFEGIEFDIFLTFNGSYVKNHKEVIRKHPLTQTDTACIIHNLKQMNRAVIISNENMLAANKIEPVLADFFALENIEMSISEDFDKLCANDIYQIMCACTEEEYETILRGTKSTKITAWWEKGVDIIPSGSGKDAAVIDVLNYYGFSTDEAIAFGDGYNDIEMLKTVGTGVAMGNANEEVKNSADEICKSVGEDGIYYYFLERNFFEAL
ncbi:MAG: Cof-type HAD-IIB family hydrolase [Bacillota bacterium]|nr:Cof-type HAD-IIB family hydrolase [Bacillota bacterium]